jgi:hypothetical protein
MTRTWTLFSLAIAGALALLLLPSGPAAPSPAYAADCTDGHTGNLVITIVDSSTDEPLNEAGSQVLIKPDPRDFKLDDIVADTAASDASASNDKDANPGVIRYEGACSTGTGSPYTISLWALPGDLTDCEIEDSSASTALDEDETERVTLQVNCSGIAATPTPAPTATPGPVATVQTIASPLAISCNGTSVISVQVRDAGGEAVQAGTTVSLKTSMGSVSPSTAVTTEAGAAFSFFTAGSTGGTAVITATAGGISNSASVIVNCGSGGAAIATATTAPPPATGSISGAIRPPNTGDAGLAAEGSSGSTGTFAAVSIVVSMAIAGGIVMTRRSRA